MKETWGSIKEDIRQNYYSKVSFPLEKEPVLAARQYFLDFLTLAPAIKRDLCFSLKNDGGGLVGYKFSDPSKGETDSKEHFHYHGSLHNLASLDDYPELGQVTGKYVQNEGVHVKGDDIYVRQGPGEVRDRICRAMHLGGTRVTNFLDAARLVHNASSDVIMHLAPAIEKDLPGFTDQVFDGKDPYFFLRFIAYHPSPKLGKPHYDRGCITLAVDESHAGLRIGEVLKPVASRNPDEAIIFLGLGLEERMAHIGLRPAYHDIESSAAPLVAPGIARTSIVFFADLKQKFEKPYSKTHPVM